MAVNVLTGVILKKYLKTLEEVIHLKKYRSKVKTRSMLKFTSEALVENAADRRVGRG